MLMECLSAGRAVSLPASANAIVKLLFLVYYNYIQIRKQFNLELAQMEAIQEKFNKMIYNGWIIQSVKK